MPGRQAQQDLRYMFDSFKNLSEAMTKQREEKLYNDILNELDPPRAGTADGRIRGEKPHRGGKTQYKLLLDREERDLNRRVKEAQIQRALRPPRGRSGGAAGYNDPPEGDPITRNGMVWNGRRWVKAPGSSSGSTSSRPASDYEAMERALNKDLIGKAGITFEDVDRLMKPRMVDESGAGTEEGKYFTADLDGKTLPMIPRQDYDKLRNRVSALKLYKDRMGIEPNAEPYAQQVRPKVAPSPSAAPVEADTPEAIKRAYKAGQITREEAEAKLQALGFTP